MTGFAGRVVRIFADNPVTPILLLIAVALGAAALWRVPREEEPQIRVPIVDVRVAAPALGAQDALELVAKPLENVVAGIEGVDEIYARVRDGAVIVSARFFVGVAAKDAVLRVVERIGANAERAPPGVGDPVVVGRGIEDVAVFVVTLAPAPAAADRHDRAALHALAEKLRGRMTRIEAVGLTYVVGAGPAEIRVEPDPDALARWGVTPLQLRARVEAATGERAVGAVTAGGTLAPARAGRTPASAQEIADLLLDTSDGSTVYVRDVATVSLAPPEPGGLVWHLSAGGDADEPRPAASVAVAKRPGANGVEVAAAAREIVETAKGDLLPPDVEAHVARDYGRSAQDNANALFIQLLSATGVIVLLIGLFVGLREALVVAVVIPATILLTFFALWTMGYTINRVSLFALIFAIGILVDDSIVVVENITRWWSRGEADRLGWTEAAVRAVDEVGDPTVISTLTIITALLPMLAVSGLMGPYMSPIPANASAAVLFSTAIALTATPWMMLRLRGLRVSIGLLSGGDAPGGPLGALYRRVAAPVLATRARAATLLAAAGLATLASFALFAIVAVPVKLLPFDDKRELQVVLDLPEGAPVEATARALRKAAGRVVGMPEVESVQIHAGTAGPFTFNGLVRQHYLRADPWLGDIKVNLAAAEERERTSHAVALDLRERLRDLDLTDGAALRIVETPPGPPVFATLLAEVYGEPDPARRDAARRVRSAFEATDFIVDVSDTIGARRERVRFEIDRAALEAYGVSERDALRAIAALLGDARLGQARARMADGGRDVVVALSRADRVASERLLAAPVPSSEGLTTLDQVVELTQEPVARPLFRRNGRDVTMVLGGLAGAREAPIYGMLAVEDRLEGSGLETRLRGQPPAPGAPTLLWHGEWDITLTTFRDLGAAFAAAALGIYAIVVWRFRRLKPPLLVMAPVPLTLPGVILGHWIMGATFTATSMIGFIALAGIVVRNSILLIEFVEARRAEGMSVREAALEAGSVRFRPIALTAATAIVGAAFILSDPIFRGLAVSLIFGLLSSTLLTVLAIPALYVVFRSGDGARAGEGTVQDG